MLGTVMDQSKIVAALESCLARTVERSHPFSDVSEYIEELKADPTWTDAEIVEVQTRVIRALMNRLGFR